MGELKILIVEDDPDLRLALVMAMQARGFEVRAAANFQAAEQIIQDGDSGFDAIISDVDLGPGPNGVDLLERARASHPEIPIILITGNATVPLRERARGLNVTAFLEKPVAPRTLISHLGI